MIKKCFTTLNQSTLLLLYKHLVRPHLEYCNTVWNLTYLTDIEKVQRRASRMLHHIRNLSYEERLYHLNLPSLSYWQFRSDMLTTFQILNGFVDLDVSEFFDLFTTTHTRGHSYKLLRKVWCQKRFFLQQNSQEIPFNIVEATSVNEFKKKFDDYFSDIRSLLYWSGLIGKLSYFNTGIIILYYYLHRHTQTEAKPVPWFATH